MSWNWKYPPTQVFGLGILGALIGLVFLFPIASIFLLTPPTAPPLWVQTIGIGFLAGCVLGLLLAGRSQ